MLSTYKTAWGQCAPGLEWLIYHYQNHQRHAVLIYSSHGFWFCRFNRQEIANMLGNVMQEYSGSSCESNKWNQCDYIIPSTGDIPRLFKSPQEGDLFTTTLETARVHISFHTGSSWVDVENTLSALKLVWDSCSSFSSICPAFALVTAWIFISLSHSHNICIGI